MSETDIVINRSLTIPLREIELRFVTSGGPGGQNVNRVATKAQLRFDLAGTQSVTEEQRERLRSSLARCLDTKGILHLSCQRTRNQHRNREEVLERFRRMLQDALRRRKRRIPTRKPKSADADRLASKRRRQVIKTQRSRVSKDDE
ncbi:MAG: aminoacyl-tRNA hydrolase [Planctomycetes bacterium]|nr:aminoacyl-tRNA hydrolase [Planctomycetota bacterium]